MLLRPSGIVTLLTDFGVADPYVGIMKGALLRASTKLQVVDLSHGVPAQDVAAGAFLWATAIARFPAGTVHVGVVDPGVGSARVMLAAAAHECYWLAPDNGLLDVVLANANPADVRRIDLEHLGVRPESATFHGRDVLAPVAAFLGSGRYGFSALGPRAETWVRGSAVDGAPRVVWVDGYGNLITNVKPEDGIRGLRAGGRSIDRRTTYSDVGRGELLSCVGSFGLLEIAQNHGDAARTLGLQRGAPIEVQRK